MHKTLIVVLSLLLSSTLIWLLTAGQVHVPGDFIPANLYRKIGESGKHPSLYSFSTLLSQQKSEEERKIVTRLGSGTYRFEDKVVSLVDGVYSGEMGGEKIRVTLADVFFSPADEIGKEPVILLLSYQEKSTSSISFYMALRLPDGSLSRATFIGHDQHVHAVNMKNGVIMVSHHIGAQDPVQQTSYAITREKKNEPIAIQPLPATFALNQ